MSDSEETVMESIHRNRSIVEATKEDRLWFTSVYTVLLAGIVSIRSSVPERTYQALLAFVMLLSLLGLAITYKSMLTHFYFISHTMKLRRDHNLHDIIPPMAYEYTDSRAVKWISRATSVAIVFIAYYTFIAHLALAELARTRTQSETMALIAFFTIVITALYEGFFLFWLRDVIYDEWGRNPGQDPMNTGMDYDPEPSRTETGQEATTDSESQ